MRALLSEMEDEIWSDLRTAIIAVEEIGLKQSAVLAIHPFTPCV